MPPREIVTLPNEILRRKARDVEDFGPELQTLIDDMIETMHGAPGIGLAAPQVGVSLRVLVIDLSVGACPDDLIVLLNPRFTEREGLQLEDEGCLSVPGITATVGRPQRVVVEATNRDGTACKVEGSGLLARALQHEIDHLEGRLYVDRLDRLRRVVLLGRIARLTRSGRW